jgi:hypothetical protein
VRFGRLVVQLLVLAFGAAAGGCAPRDQAVPADNGATREVPAMEEQAATDQLQADLSAEPEAGGARFVLTVRNRANEPVEVTFPTGQAYDFEVRQAGQSVWRWSDERMFTQAIRTERLSPGESWTFEERWQADPGMSGEFEVVGRLASSDRPLEQVARFRLP